MSDRDERFRLGASSRVLLCLVLFLHLLYVNYGALFASWKTVGVLSVGLLAVVAFILKVVDWIDVDKSHRKALLQSVTPYLEKICRASQTKKLGAFVLFLIVIMFTLESLYVYSIYSKHLYYSYISMYKQSLSQSEVDYESLTKAINLFPDRPEAQVYFALAIRNATRDGEQRRIAQAAKENNLVGIAKRRLESQRDWHSYSVNVHKLREESRYNDPIFFIADLLPVANKGLPESVCTLIETWEIMKLSHERRECNVSRARMLLLQLDICGRRPDETCENQQAARQCLDEFGERICKSLTVPEIFEELDLLLAENKIHERLHIYQEILDRRALQFAYSNQVDKAIDRYRRLLWARSSHRKDDNTLWYTSPEKLILRHFFSIMYDPDRYNGIKSIQNILEDLPDLHAALLREWATEGSIFSRFPDKDSWELGTISNAFDSEHFDKLSRLGWRY